MTDNIFANIKTIFDFGRGQEKKIFTQLKRLLRETKATIEYTNIKSDKRLPHDFKISLGTKTITLDVETTPNTSPWHGRWIKQGTTEEVLNRGLRMPMRKFVKQSGGKHIYLKLSPDRKCFFCFIFPDVIEHMKDGEEDRRNAASHVKPNNNFFKVVPWSVVEQSKNCVIVDNFPALRTKIMEMLKK